MPAQIREFTIAGGDDVRVDSHAAPQLRWDVRGASRVEIRKEGPGPDIGALDAPELGVRKGSRRLQFAVWEPYPDATTIYTMTAFAPAAAPVKAVVRVRTRMSERNRALMDLQDAVLDVYGALDVRAKKEMFFRAGRSSPKYQFTHLNLSFVLAGAGAGAAVGGLAGALAGAVIGLALRKNLCFAYGGIAYAKTDDIKLMNDEHKSGRAGNVPLNLTHPSMLFFDDDSRLIGCGFFRHDRNDPAVFAARLPLASEEWFLHVGGKHTADGGFRPDGRGVGVRHATSWDIHIYFNVDSRGRARGVPIAGMTSKEEHLRRVSRWNVPYGTAPGVIDNRFCEDGVSTRGLFVYPA